MDRSKLDTLIELVNQGLAESAYECIEAEWVGSDRILRLFIDHKQTPAQDGQSILVDDCAKVSRLLGESEDLDQAIHGSYQLEVSSPGVERPLRFLKHFQAVVGQQVTVKLLEKIGNRQNGTGTLLEAAPDSIKLDTAEGAWSFPLSALKKANLVFDWDSGQ